MKGFLLKVLTIITLYLLQVEVLVASSSSYNPGHQPMSYPDYTCKQFLMEKSVDELKALTKAFSTIKTTLSWIADSATYNFYITLSAKNINNLLAATLAAHGRILEDTGEVLMFISSEVNQNGIKFFMDACSDQNEGSINIIASTYYMSYKEVQSEK